MLSELYGTSQSLKHFLKLFGGEIRRPLLKAAPLVQCTCSHLGLLPAFVCWAASDLLQMIYVCMHRFIRQLMSQ